MATEQDGQAERDRNTAALFRMVDVGLTDGAEAAVRRMMEFPAFRAGASSVRVRIFGYLHVLLGAAVQQRSGPDASKAAMQDLARAAEQLGALTTEELGTLTASLSEILLHFDGWVACNPEPTAEETGGAVVALLDRTL